MNKVFENLQPEPVWRFFSDVMAIPRPSKHEEQISAFLQKFGTDRGLETLHDELGNVLIRKPASKGKENSPWVCLQAHMDMVCEKNSDKNFDFYKDSIQPVLAGEWVTADGTTLGADDGIGVATALAILDADNIEHGPIECLFTIDEETGLTGAFGLSDKWLKSRILINLDSEDEGEMFIGCAGGIDTLANVDYKKVPVDANTKAYEIKVFGLKGGHSGDDINKGLACANKLMTRILWNTTNKLGVRLAHIDAGNLRNAIAREAVATVTVPADREKELLACIPSCLEKMRFEFRSTEPNMQITLTPCAMPANLIDKQTQDNLLNALYACAHGVLAMSREIPNFVETSTNLASVKMDDNKIYITTSQRSSVDSSKDAAAQKIEATFRLIGANVTHSDGYPGWAPNPDSKILNIAVDTYKKLFGHEPIVRAIHAGLECGLIGEKYQGMDMISYGPTLRGVHSPDERIEIKTVKMFWDHTLAILKEI